MNQCKNWIGFMSNLVLRNSLFLFIFIQFLPLTIQKSMGSEIDVNHQKERISMEEVVWGKTVDNWRLSISTDKSEFNVEEVIFVTVIFQNVSSEPQKVAGNGRHFDFVYECYDEANKRVPLSEYGKKMKKNKGLGKTVVGVVDTKKEIVAEVSLSRHLDLSLTGNYRLTISRKAKEIGINEDPIVASNQIEFEIVE